MEERQSVEESVGFPKVNHCEHLADVGQDVPVCQFDAFGIAFGTAGEQDDGGVRVPMSGRR